MIVNATVDYTQKTLTIAGQNFGSNPTITVDSLTFPIASVASNQIVGNFPASNPPSSFASGTYLLTLRFTNQLPAVFVIDIAATGATGPRYVANGDGTVTDNKTGLMWEMKDGTCTVPLPYAGPHCLNNTYTWSNSAVLGDVSADGTLFTSFIAGLNGGDYYNPSVGLDVSAGPGTCFANHRDWRIPTVAELQSILTAQYPNCTAAPCIDPIFGPTQASNGYYWSSSSVSGFLNHAWVVGFGNGFVTGGAYKTNLFYARAVRSGRF